MTAREFLIEKNKKTLQKAAKCKSREEFKRITDESHMKIKEEELQKAYEAVCKGKKIVLSNDTVKSVTGGGLQNVVHGGNYTTHDYLCGEFMPFSNDIYARKFCLNCKHLCVELSKETDFNGVCMCNIGNGNDVRAIV